MGSGRCGLGVPVMVIAGVPLVPSSLTDVGGYSAHFSFASFFYSFLSLRTASPAVGEEIPVERLEVIRKRFQSRGISSGVVKLLMGSVRRSTVASYQSAWKR